MGKNITKYDKQRKKINVSLSRSNEEHLEDITNLSPGTNGCSGLLKIVHSMAGDSTAST